jgi:hypothetical protein
MTIQKRIKEADPYDLKVILDEGHLKPEELLLVPVLHRMADLIEDLESRISSLNYQINPEVW